MNNPRNDIISEIKLKNDITTVAYELGFKVNKRSGSYIQGDCPQHCSEHGTCLTIWSGIQAFKCYHCGESGDVINLVMLFKHCDFKTAIKYLADRVGMPLYGGKEMTDEEKAKLESDLQEEKLVYDMLTEEARWYHAQLKKYPVIMDHLRTHYKFSEEIIEELQIGFAPPGSSLPMGTSELAAHLEASPEFKGKLALSSLFSFKDPTGPYYDFFKGRITFPYWHGGKVVYMAARATSLTPPEIFECYTNKDCTIKVDDKGNPAYIKYKKLRIYDQNDEKKRHFSRFIQNDVFLGEDTIRGKDEVIITEGFPDWISAVDHGFPAVSPVTVRFREEDWEKLGRITRHAKAIYLINDNEDSEAGYKGAISTGLYLSKLGRTVYLVMLPRPEGIPKIDLNEYFLNHTAADLKQLMDSAKTVLDILIEKLPEDFLKAQAILQNEIAPILIELDDIVQKHYLAIIKKRVKTEKNVLIELIETAKKEKVARVQQQQANREAHVDEEIKKAALTLAQDPEVFRKRIDVINESGVVGERKNIAMNCCTIDSRNLPDDKASPNTLAVKNAGHFGSGKSYTLAKTVQFYPSNAYHMIMNGSAKSLYFLEGGLKNKCLIVSEGFQLQNGNAEDSEFAYIIRSLLSEGEVTYLIAQKDEEGHYVTVERRVEGPTPFITTTIMENLEPQLEDRLFTIHPDESVDQTKDIIKITAQQKAGNLKQLDEKQVKTWQQFHALLKPVKVIIPFAPLIADYITQSGVVPIPTRRAFKRVLILVQAIASVYQYQRKRTPDGSVIAEIADYDMALQVVNEAFRESLGQQDQKTEDRLSFIQEKGIVTHRELTKHFGVAPSTVTAWISKRIREGSITWCDAKGDLFEREEDLKKAKHAGTAYIRISDSYDLTDVTGLPSSFDLTKDPAWDEGGEYYRLYDLHLNESGPSTVFHGVRPIQNTQSKTHNDGQVDVIIDYYTKKDDGVRVFDSNQGINTDIDNVVNDIKIPEHEGLVTGF